MHLSLEKADLVAPALRPILVPLCQDSRPLYGAFNSVEVNIPPYQNQSLVSSNGASSRCLAQTQHVRPNPVKKGTETVSRTQRTPCLAMLGLIFQFLSNAVDVAGRTNTEAFPRTRVSGKVSSLAERRALPNLYAAGYIFKHASDVPSINETLGACERSVQHRGHTVQESFHDTLGEAVCLEVAQAGQAIRPLLEEWSRIAGKRKLDVQINEGRFYKPTFPASGEPGHVMRERKED